MTSRNCYFFHLVQISINKRIEFGDCISLHSRLVNKHIKLTGKAKRNYFMEAFSDKIIQTKLDLSASVKSLLMVN